MTEDTIKRQWVAWLIVATVITALTIWLGVTYPVPAPPGVEPPVALGTTHFTDIAITEDLSVGDDLAVTGLATVGETLAVTGNATFSALFMPSFTDNATSDGDTITAAKTIYALDTSGAVTITLGTSGASEGQLLIIINDDANATVIADTNLRSSDGGAITLAGAYDVALFVFQDSEWLEIAKSANS